MSYLTKVDAAWRKAAEEQITKKSQDWYTVSHQSREAVCAASVYRVIQIANSKPYVALSASRKKYSHEENNRRNAALLAQIKAYGLYAYEMVGGFVEDGVQVVESSFFVPWRENALSLPDFILAMATLAWSYEQDAVLAGLPGEGPEVQVGAWSLPVGHHYFLYPSGKADSVGTKAAVKTFDQYGSIALDPHKNRAIEWQVVGVVQPQSVISRAVMDRMGLTWVMGDTKTPPEGDEGRAFKMLRERGYKFQVP